MCWSQTDSLISVDSKNQADGFINSRAACLIRKDDLEDKNEDNLIDRETSKLFHNYQIKRQYSSSRIREKKASINDEETDATDRLSK